MAAAERMVTVTAKGLSRLNVFLAIIILIFVVLVGRFGYLQMIDGAAYRVMAD